MVARRYGPWFKTELERIGVSFGQLSYLTRPHNASGGTELSHSNLKKLAEGRGAPTVNTVIRIAQLSAQLSGQCSSTLCALSHSYPEIIVSIIIGLDLVGLDEYWRIRTRTAQLPRHRLRSRLQKRLGRKGFEALHSLPDFTTRRDNFSRLLGDSTVRNWVKRLQPRYDLLAVSVAYSYFGPFFGDTESMEMRAIFNEYDADRERIYVNALERYRSEVPPTSRPNGAYDHNFLEQAQRVLIHETSDDFRVSSVVSPLLGAWANGFASDFIIEVPLLSWVDDDTLRENLGLDS